MTKKLLSFASALLLCACTIHAQKKVFTAGFSFRPMIVSDYFNGGSQTSTSPGINYTIIQNFGYSMGMIVRKGLTNVLTFETGLNFVQRNYTLSIDSIIGNYHNELPFRYVSYGIPLKLMVMLRSSESSYFSVSFGANIDLYPSDVSSSSEIWIHETVRKSWIQASLLSDIGWEYHFETAGFLYAGASFQLPFTKPYLAKIGVANSVSTTTSMDVSGTFLALEIRYYFPMKRKKLEQ